MPTIPDVPPRALLAIRICQLVFGILSLSLSAAAISVYKNIPRPATGDNIFLLTASAIGLLTTAYRITTYRLRNPQGKHRLIPLTTESLVILILLAAFIYGAVTTSTGRGGCSSGTTTTVGGEGDGEEGGEGEGEEGGVVLVGRPGSGKACALTKAATAFTAGNFASFCASAYTVGKAIYDEKQLANSGPGSYSV